MLTGGKNVRNEREEMKDGRKESLGIQREKLHKERMEVQEDNMMYEK